MFEEQWAKWNETDIFKVDLFQSLKYANTQCDSSVGGLSYVFFSLEIEHFLANLHLY